MLAYRTLSVIQITYEHSTDGENSLIRLAQRFYVT